MLFVLGFLFWLSIFLLGYTYVLYPMLVKWLAPKGEVAYAQYEDDTELPIVTVLMSLYNEELVIEEKMQCLLALDYPKDKLRLYIGSDNSSDATNAIVDGFVREYPEFNIIFEPFKSRQGKPGVINTLADRACSTVADGDTHIMVITDANVMLQPFTLKKLVRHFKHPSIGIVDAHMIHTGVREEGISTSENYYISSEVLLKNSESRLWRVMAGPFGGCYALRAEYFTPVPSNFLVDDFYITMKVLEQGGEVINDLEAICYESITHHISDEYRRKKRISAGNFQNLVTFPHLWWPFWKLPNVVIFSHKVLRWFGPFLILTVVLTSAMLAFLPLNIVWPFDMLYKFAFFALTIGVLAILALDWVLRKMKINIFILKSIRYFIYMNIALFEGFINFLKGVKNNVWQPSKRH